MVTLIIPATDSIKAITTSFIFSLCEINLLYYRYNIKIAINLKGRSILNNLKILINPKSTPENIKSIKEQITIKKSS